MALVDLRLRDVDPALMWSLKQAAAHQHKTLRAFLLGILEEVAKKHNGKK